MQVNPGDLIRAANSAKKREFAAKSVEAEIERLRALLRRVDMSAVKASGDALDIAADYIVEAAVIDAVHEATKQTSDNGDKTDV